MWLSYDRALQIQLRQKKLYLISPIKRMYLRCCSDWKVNKMVGGVYMISFPPLFQEGCQSHSTHDNFIKWKHFPRNWPFVWGIHRWPVNFLHRGQWRGAFIFYLICARVNGWVNILEAGDVRRHSAHYDVIVMSTPNTIKHPDTSCSSNGLSQLDC